MSVGSSPGPFGPDGNKSQTDCAAAHLGIAVDGDQAQADAVLQLSPAHLRQLPRQIVVQPQL